MNCPYVVCRTANTGLSLCVCSWERSSMGKSSTTSGDGSSENQWIFLVGFNHCYYDYLGLLWSYDVYVCISGDGSNSTHNITGLREEGLNSGDYSLPLALVLSLFYPIFPKQMLCLSFQSLLRRWPQGWAQQASIEASSGNTVGFLEFFMCSGLYVCVSWKLLLCLTTVVTGMRCVCGVVCFTVWLCTEQTAQWDIIAATCAFTEWWDVNFPSQVMTEDSASVSCFCAYVTSVLNLPFSFDIGFMMHQGTRPEDSAY